MVWHMAYYTLAPGVYNITDIDLIYSADYVIQLTGPKAVLHAPIHPCAIMQPVAHHAVMHSTSATLFTKTLTKHAQLQSHVQDDSGNRHSRELNYHQKRTHRDSNPKHNSVTFSSH